MADITMCTNTLCPKAKSCYRTTAYPNPYRQSYALFEYEEYEDGCGHYIEDKLLTGKPLHDAQMAT